MDSKEWLAVSTLAVSIFAAWSAFDAKNATQRLEKLQFESDITMDLLSSVFREITAQNDAVKAATSCIFVEVLGRAEQNAKDKPPYFVKDFIVQVDEAGLWDADCKTRLEALSPKADAPQATSISRPGPQEPQLEVTNKPSQIGRWHALIASYSATSRGCEEAKKDISEFDHLLANKGNDGRFIYIVRTKISNNYAVTIDAGDDRELAVELSRQIRSVAPSNGTGADSFVQGNREWFIDPDCAKFSKIGS